MRLGIRAVVVLVCMTPAVVAPLGCVHMPQSATSTVDEAPAIVIANAPEGASLWVDGVDYGAAAAYSGEQALRLRPGTHVVEVRRGEETVLRREVFLGSASTKTLTVPAGPQ